MTCPLPIDSGENVNDLQLIPTKEIKEQTKGTKYVSFRSVVYNPIALMMIFGIKK